MKTESGGDEGEGEEEGGEGSAASVACRYCTGNDTSTLNRFMIGCDRCERWFHGPCLAEWLRSDTSTRRAFRTLYGTCPYCQSPLAALDTALDE